MAEDYVLQTKITADSTQFDATLKKTGKSLTAFSSEITKVTKIVGGLFAITSLTALAKSISDVSQEFSKATSNIAKGTGATGKALDDLAKSVNKAMLNGVGRSASEVGSMVADLNTRFNVTGETLERMVASFDDFASVTDTDVKTSINTVADIMAKWNISIDDSDKLLDQLTVASQMSGASVTELSTSLAKGQSILSQFGMSLTESTALFASLKKNGVDTSVALAGMRTALANFSKDGKNAKTAFEEVSEKIKNAKTQTEALQIATETFGIRSGAEMLKVLQSSAEGTGNFAEALRKAGGALEETDRASRTSKDALDDLKATIQATFFTGGGDSKLRDTIDGIASAIRNFDFSSIKETFSNIGLFIQGVWGQIKELFNRLSGAIDITGGNFKIFADIIYENLNHAYQVIQDFVGMISAILNGDWSVAWDYAKLIVLRTVKEMEVSVNNAIKLMPNLFNSVIEGYNWVLEQQDKLFLDIFHLPEKYFKSAKLPKFEGKDIIDTTSIDEAIEKVRKVIETKTGKVADNTLKDLKRQKDAVHKTTQAITGDIGSLGTAVEDTTKTTGTKITGFFEEWGKQYEDLAGDWNKTFVDMANIGTDTMGDMFTMLGENLAGAGHGYEDFTVVALEGLAQILQALASQITALGVTKALMGDYASATIAVAGATTALVASGVATAVASNMKKTSDSVKDVGDAAEKSEGQLEEFMKKLEQIKEGTYGQEAGLTFLGMKKIEAEIAEARKNYEYWVAEYDRRKTQWAKYISEWPSLAKTLPPLKEALSELTKASDILNTALTKYNSVVSEAIQTQRDLTINNYETADSYKYLYDMASQFYQDEIIMSKAGQFKQLLKESLSADISQLVKDAWTSLSSIGKDLGEQFFSSIEEGADSADFLINMKKIIRNNMLKIAVYTQSFNDKMAEIGTKLVSAISGGPKWLLGEAKYELEELYESTLITTKSIDSLLDNVFGKTSESIDTATNSLTKFENAMKDLLESIQDLGGDIASNLVDALSNGLTQSDFLGNMKTWLRNMMIQMVVYTDTMKAEVEEIGKRISEGLTSGFTDTSLHEIRRDLSYIFEQTSSKMANLDTILDGVFSGYATGTENARRGIHLVGEAGPELVQFKGGERVFNNRDTMSMIAGGNPSNNFNVTFNNLQDTSAFAMMSQLKQYQREMAFNAVI